MPIKLPYATGAKRPGPKETVALLAGLMALPPREADPDQAFRRLQQEHERVRDRYPQANRLSAGMSNDLEAAIKYGSTCVRVGTALMGQRPLTSR